MNREKLSSEVTRLTRAFGYSWDGLKAAWKHPAFRVELLAAAVLIPVALTQWNAPVKQALLVGSIMLVLIVELLNTGIEAAIDRISPEKHELSKLAKDVGSAAVLLALINAGLVWLLMLA